MIPKELSSQLIRYCGRMDHKGWVANHDGNLSARFAAGSFVATPTARAKIDLEAKDLIEVDSSGKVTSGKGKVFSEWSIHSLIYSKRPDVQAVVHAHPPSAMSVGCANQEMLTWAVPEAVVSLGPGVPLIVLGVPGASEIQGELEQTIPHYDAVMVAGNGVFCWGKDLEQAFLRLELVEHLAKVLLGSMTLGGPKLLSHPQVVELLKKRSAAGLALPPDPVRPHWFLN